VNNRGTARRYLSDWLVWAIIAGGIVAVFGYYDIARDIGRPFGGYVGFRPTAIDTGEVDANTPIWWSGMTWDRLDHGDTLVRVEQLPYYPDLRDTLAHLYESGERAVELEVIPRDSDQIEVITLPLTIFTIQQFMDVRLPDIIVSFVFWSLAIVVYTSWPGGPANRAFALTAATIALVRALFVHTVFMDDTFSVGLETFQQFMLPLMGVTFIHFAGTFPVPARPYWRWLTITGLAISVLVAIFAVALRLPVSPSTPAIPYELLADLRYFGTLLVYVIGVGAFVGRIVHRLGQHRHQISRREKRMLGIVILGFIIAMPLLLVSALTWLTVDGRPVSYFWQGLDTRYLLLAVPLTLAYALVRYQAMRSPSRLFVFIMAISASALIAALGAWLWTLDHDIWPGSGLRPPFIIFFGIGLFSSFLWIILTSLRGPMGRIFEYDRRSNHAARSFGHRLLSEKHIHDLPRTIARTLVEAFELERAAIWLNQSGESLILAASEGDFHDTPPNRLRIPEIIEPWGPMRIDRVDGQPAWLLPLTGKELDLALPLMAGDELIGLIGLGPHWDTEIFDERRVETADLIGQHATLLLVANRNFEALRQVPGRMAEVQERERERLAQELHDGIQQFLGRLPFYLAVGRDAVHDQPDLTVEILDRMIADVDSAAGEVRQIRHNLAPSQLAHGLTSSLTALAHHFQDRTGVQTQVELSELVDERTDLTSRHAIYRFVQQALDNVEAHAEATAVTINLQALPERVTFFVRDNGSGVSAEQRTLALRNGSFGLESMRARLEACGGSFRFESDNGRGTTVGGWVPGIHQPERENGRPQPTD
jgi:signal transduction histidine kinase